MEGFEGIIYLAIIALMFGGGFGNIFGGNAGNPVASQADVQRGFDAMNSQDQQRDILTAVNNGTSQAVAATSQAKYDTINALKDTQMYLGNQIADVRTMEQSILGQTAQCCCDTKQLIMSTAAETNANIAQAKYENAMNLAGLEQRLTSKLDQNKIEALQAQVSQLQLQQAMQGVIRFPNGYTYNAGPFPPFYGCPNAVSA